MKRKTGYIAVWLVLGLFWAGCELVGETGEVSLDEVTDIRYGRHVQPLLNEKCTSCHGGSTPEAGLSLESWENLIAGSDFGEAVIAFDAESSLLVKMVTQLAGRPHPLEQGADTLTQVETDFLIRWIEEGARDDGGEVPYAGDGERLYVCNQDDATVSVIDTETNVVVRTVRLTDFGFSVNAKPHHAAVEPDGAFWYVTLIGDNKVLKFNRANELVGQADFETPGLVAIHPTEDLLFVGRSLSAINPPTSIGMIRRSDMTIEEVPVVLPRPHALAIDPTGGYVFSASLALDALITLDLATEDVTFTTVGGLRQTFVQHTILPDGKTMFSTGQTSNQVLVFDISNPTDIRQVDAINVSSGPWHPTHTPDGRFVYVGNLRANTATVIDTESRFVVDIISGNGFAEPHGSAASADGLHVYLSNRNTLKQYTPRYDFGDNDDVGTVVVINTLDNRIEKVLEVGRNTTGIGIAIASPPGF